ncbi:PDGLE domain-containing protein [Catellatospora sp. NPDC049609]|uniref:PDGLE domain-containing protein n=1 Tax=Catellatospora sp. NPDC049609 TaxID=3155505 RepID=UPI003419C082
MRPDLVYALHGNRLDQPATGGLPTRTFVLGGLAVAAVLAGGVSYLASGEPDGLDATTLTGCTVDADGVITGGSCIAQQAQDHELGGSILADYGITGLDGATGLAGLIGVALTFAVGLAIFWAARRRRAAAAAPQQAPDAVPAEK